MKASHFFCTLSIATLGLIANATAAKAITFQLKDWTGDTEFQNLVNTHQFDETWVVESRIGNNTPNGTYEVDILDADNNLLPVAEEQRQWLNDGGVDFKVEFKGSLLKYSVGNQLLSTTQFDNKPIADLFFRARSTDTSKMSLTNLFVNGVALPDLIADASNNIQYLSVSDFGNNLTITGTSTFSWTGTAPKNSLLAYQIKAGVRDEEQSVPEPATMSLLSLSALGALGWKSRRVRSR